MSIVPTVIYVDVDDTLVRSIGAKRIPMPGTIQRIKDLHALGHALYLWSSGGGDYAKEAAIELGLESLFIAFLPKPQLYIDDQEVHEWRTCRHIFPGQDI